MKASALTKSVIDDAEQVEGGNIFASAHNVRMTQVWPEVGLGAWDPSAYTNVVHYAHADKREYRRNWSAFHGSTFAAPEASQMFGQVYADKVEESLRQAFGYRNDLLELNSKIDALHALVSAVLTKLDSIDTTSHSIAVPIESFGSAPYEVLNPFSAVLMPCDDGFEASYYDGNASSYGDTEVEAVDNLRELLTELYDRLNQLGDAELGPGPKRQKVALNRIMRRIG